MQFHLDHSIKPEMKTLVIAYLFVLTLTGCTPKLVSNSDVKVKVMSYNVHHCNPPSKPGVIDVDAVTTAIRRQNPDIVALQEIDADTERSGKGNQAAILAEKMGMEYFFARAIDFQGGEYGIAILSKFKISEARIHRLPTKEGTDGEPRVLATVRLKIPGIGFIRFGNTHMDAQREDTNRDLQIREIARLTATEKLPYIIAGDFNAPPGSGIINELDASFKRTCTDCPFTIPVITPKTAIDFIAYRPAHSFSISSHEVIPERYASDHLPVVAELVFIRP